MSNIAVDDGGIQFFGKVDKKRKDGGISSEYPAWMMSHNITELKEGIHQKERAISEGYVRPENVSSTREQLMKEKSRLDEILESKPKLSDKHKDDISNEYKKLGSEIADSMFTRSDMELGLADPHEEARRMVEPIIKINPKIAEACGVTHSNGMVSRNQAQRIWRIMGGALEANTNPESLRRDRRK